MATSGPEELIELGKALKGAEKPIRAGTLKALKAAATTDVQDAVRDEGAPTLPQRGGLAERAAAVRVSAKVRLSGRQAGVRIVGRGRMKNLDALDRGTVRHPLFGDRAHWYPQTVLPGWWSRPITARAPQIRAKLAETIGEELKTLVRE